MKNTLYQLLLLPLLLLTAWGARAQSVLQQESFETDGATGANPRYTTNGFNYTTITGGTTTQTRNQYFQRVTQTSTSYDPPPNTLPSRDAAGNGSASAGWCFLPVSGGTLDGSYFFAGEGVRGYGGNLARNPGDVTLNAVSIASKTNLQVKVALLDGRGTYANWSPNTTTNRSVLKIQVNIDGAGWNTIGQFASDQVFGGPLGAMRLDANYDEVGDAGAAQLTTTFTDYTFDVGSSGNSMQTRVLADINGLSTEFGFDNIRVLGTTATGAAPVVANIEPATLNYAEGSGAVQITNTTTVSDTDSPQLSGATAKFTTSGLYDSSEDRLVFATQNGITGSFDIPTGVLTLTGASSVANYQTALRSVQYQDIDAANATPGNRVVSFTVTDNTSLTSGTVARTITVTTALSAPTGLPYAEDLETDGEGTRYASNKATAALVAGRFFNRTATASEPGGQWHSNGSSATTISGINNSYYWWASGSSSLSNGTGTFTTLQINTANYTNLTFSVKLAASNNVWENFQYLRVAYRLGGSSGTWVPLLSFRSSDQTSTVSSTTGSLKQDTNPATTTGVPTGTAQLTPTLTTYSASLPASANGQLVEFQINALSSQSDGVGEVIAFDNLQLTGTQLVAPTVTTATPTSVGSTSATLGGNVTADGGDAVTGRGVVYSSTNASPTLGAGGTSTAPNGSGTGTFSATISSLTPNTVYYVQAYAINSIGTSYGGVQTFTTAAAVPTVTTAAATIISSSSAVLGGNVTAANGATVTARGVVYSVTSTNGTPTIGGTGVTNAPNGSGTGSFSATISGLSAGTSYSVQAYATNSAGTSYGGVQTFTTTTTTPTVTTAAVTSVTSSSAVLGGNVTADGGATVTARGVVYSVTSTNGTPTIGGTGVTNDANGTGTGSFSATISSLTPGISYSVQAYATNANGTVYGGVQTFTTLANLATVTTAAATSITQTSAVLGGSVTASGGATVTARGVVYSLTSTNGTPTIGGSGVSNTAIGSGTGNFSATISGLSAGTSYSVQAYATNSAGTSYGGVQTFTTQQAVVATSRSVTVQLDASGNGTLQANSGTTGVNNGSTGAGTPTYTIQKIVYGRVTENNTLTLTTPNGANFTGIRFASYGTPIDNGNGNYRLNSGCNAANSVTTAQNSFSTTRSTGSMDAVNTAGVNNTPQLGDPCPNTAKYLAVQAAYSADATSLTYDCTEAGKTQYVLLTVTDANGNTSTATAQVTVNAPPAIAITSVSPNSAQRGTTVTVSGSNLGGVTTVTVGGAAAAVSGSSAGSFAFVVPNTATIGAGNLTVTAPCSQTVTSTFTVTAPALTATVSTTSGTPTSTSPIPFTVNFSQSVGTTFTASDVTVTGGGTPTNFSGSGAGPYTFTVTPSGAGTVTVSVAAGMANDANNTQNQASNSVIVQYQSPTITLSPSSLPQGTVGVAYSQTLTASGGTSPYSYSVASGALPNGLTLASNGALSGMPTASGSFNFTVRATDSGTPVATGDQSYTLTIARPTITLSPSSVPNGTVGMAYSQTLTASGGTGSYSYSITAGATPNGLTISQGGVLSGTPTAGGTFNFTVTATDAYNSTGSQAYTVVIAAPTITVAPAALSGGTQGTAYSQTITASGGTAPYSFTTTPSALPPGLTLSSGGVLSGTPTAGGSYTFTVTATDASTGGSYTGSRTYTLVITTTFTSWTGNTSTDWFTSSNWTGGVPTATVDATIPTSPSGNRYPFIRSGMAIARNLSIGSNAAIAQDGGTLDVRANLTNNGSFTPTGGTAVLGAGTVVSSILGSSNTRFFNLTVGASAAQSNTSASTSVQQLLTLNGNFTTNGNSFTLESNAASTAMVVNNGSNVVSGNVTVQRYIDASGNTGTSGYRHYSSPVSNATVSSLSTSNYGGSFTAQVNAAYNTADPNLLTLATYPNVFSYDESKIAASPAVSFSDFDKGYQSPLTLNDGLTVGRGYAVQIGNTEKVQFNGPLNNSTQNITGLTYAATGTPGAGSAGWALVGNPYPAPLDWRTVGTATGSSLSGVDGAAYVFQSTSAYSGRYTSFTNNVGAGTGLIASGQGFFVHTSTPGTSGSITLTNANRVTTYANPAFQRTTAETRPLLRLSLGLGSQPATVATAQDETFVYFEAGASDGFDGKYDAYKLANPSGYYLGSVTPGTSPLGLSIDARSPLAAATLTEIPLWVSLPAGTYTLTATELLNFAGLAGGTQVQLRDALLGTLTDLATTPSHNFQVAANAPYAGRFALVFRTSQVLATATTQAGALVSLYPNPVDHAQGAVTLAVTGLPAAATQLEAAVLNALGQVVSRTRLPAPASGAARVSLSTQHLATGLYQVRLTGAGLPGGLTCRLTVN